MKRKYVYIVAIVLVVFCAILITFILFMDQVSLLVPETIENKQTVYFENSKQTIYLSAKHWGFDHDEIVISTLPLDKRPNDSQTDYVFYCTELFFQKREGDSLIIFLPPNWDNYKIPINLINKPVIVFERQDSSILKNYEKHGINKIDVFSKKVEY